MRSTALLFLVAFAAACSESQQPVSVTPVTRPALDGASEASLTSAALDAGATATDADAPEVPKLAALFMQTPVMSDMEWPREDGVRKPKSDDPRDKVIRLGYIRHGAKVPVIPEPHKKSNCQEGWYELVAGGFVCGKYGTLDMNHPRVRLGPQPPDMTTPLPYRYGYNIANGTPLYRTVPSREERLRLEPWLAPKRKVKKQVEEDSSTLAAQGPQSGQRIADESDGGLLPIAVRVTEPSTDPLDAGVPWYLRDYDGGKPQVTLEDLRGEGPIARRMVKGFYLALEKEFPVPGPRWWKTTGGLIAPYERIYVQKPLTEFHGVWIQDMSPGAAFTPDAGAPVDQHQVERRPTPEGTKPADGRSAATPQPGQHQVGFILWTRAHKYTLSADRKKATQGDAVSRFTTMRLTGDTVSLGGAVYDETEDGWWMKSNEGVKTKPGAPPSDLAPNEKWVDVNLTNQTLVAFEGEKPVYATLVSTGKRNFQDKDKDHPTPTGSFRIREKHIAATMDGDVASDGPYSIEDVPWIMYFSGSYALHGAFWHANFGHVQSHGCVNLSPLDAKAMFGWTEPHLPEGWHGVVSSAERLGTRVVVHD